MPGTTLNNEKMQRAKKNVKNCRLNAEDGKTSTVRSRVGGKDVRYS